MLPIKIAKSNTICHEFEPLRPRMESALDHISEEHNPLLAPTADDHLTSETAPRFLPGSFWTGLRNVQCLNLVSVSVNVSTNREEDRGHDEDDSQKSRPSLTTEKQRQQQSTSNTLQTSHTNDEPRGSFSTLLRNFQIFNLVSVLVNVSTNHEDERRVKPEKKEKKKKVPDYYRDIFGDQEKVGSEKGEKSAIHLQDEKYLPTSKIPIMFRIRNADRVEACTVSAASSLTDLMSRIEGLAKSSPNCGTSALLPNAREGKDWESGIKVREIEVVWNIGEERNGFERTILTEENWEAVLLLMERGMMGILNVEVEKTGEEGVQDKYVRNALLAAGERKVDI